MPYVGVYQHFVLGRVFMEELNNKKPLKERKLDLIVGIMLILMIVFALLFALGYSQIRGGAFNLRIALTVVAIFSGAKVYFIVVTVLLFRGKSRKKNCNY